MQILQSIVDNLEDSISISNLAEQHNLTRRSVRRIANSLEEKGLVHLSRSRISQSSTMKSSLISKLSRTLDISKLLIDSGEWIFQLLTEPRTLEELEKSTGLSTPTLYRTLNRMMETGVITLKDKKYAIDTKQQDAYMLARIMNEEYLSKVKRDTKNEEMMFHQGNVIIKKVPKGQGASGSPTAFSIFPSFGMQLYSEGDYYIFPPQGVTIEDTLVHALLVSKNKLERTHCAVFYALNRERLDLAILRKKAEEFKIAQLLLQLEAFVQGRTVPEDTFLPWSEFAERCRLYGIDAAKLLPPPAHPKLFEEIGVALQDQIDVFLIGGENMRIKKIKQATKDVDIVVQDTRSYSKLLEALSKIGYRPLTKSETTPTDRRLRPSGILVKDGYPRIDVFTKVICNKLHLIEIMITNSETSRFGKLRLHLLSNEDVFLLKSVAGREADDVDMLEILRKTRNFDWNRMLRTLYEEEKVTGRHFCFDLFDSIGFIQESTDMKIPIYRNLISHSTDQAILQVLQRNGWMGARDITSHISQIRESEVRNRLRALITQKKVSKRRFAGRVIFRIKK